MSLSQPTSAITCPWIIAAATVVLAFLLCATSCFNRQQDASPGPIDDAYSDPAKLQEFDVHWPLLDPAAENAGDAKTLLTGQLTVQPDRSHASDQRLLISLTLIRPESDEHRSFWNASLEYREHQWMRRVRVWDANRMWLYPNLPYLFKLHGVDRIERYGGWDAGHKTDNDFGAVLIRCCSAADEQGESVAPDDPLVSAAWYAVGVEGSTLRTIVHRARSDEFVVHLPGDVPNPCGRIKLWFVYGDFMEHAMPESWPQEPELDGGSLAFFYIDWRWAEGKPVEVQITPRTPEPTGFDWHGWVGRPEESVGPVGAARLETFLH